MEGKGAWHLNHANCCQHQTVHGMNSHITCGHPVNNSHWIACLGINIYLYICLLDVMIMYILMLWLITRLQFA